MAAGKGSKPEGGRKAEAGESQLGGTAIHPETLRQIVQILDASDITRLDWKRGDERLIIRRGPEAPVHHHAAPMQVAMPAPVMQAPVLQAAPVAAPAAAPAAAAAPAKAEEKKPGTVVTSPFVGTFYRAPSPDAPVFAEVGQVVRKGQVLCIIEAMKLMNEIEAEAPGKIAEVIAQNGQTVEFGQPLFRIEPA